MLAELAHTIFNAESFARSTAWRRQPESESPVGAAKLRLLRLPDTYFTRL